MVNTQSAHLYTHLEAGRNKLVRTAAETGVAYMDVGGATPRMGEVEPRLEQQSRAT